jgi:hypothetical protein
MSEKKNKADDFTAQAVKLFAEYPHLAVLYFTSDGIAFTNGNDAVNHSRELGDGQIRTIKR